MLDVNTLEKDAVVMEQEASFLHSLPAHQGIPLFLGAVYADIPDALHAEFGCSRLLVAYCMELCNGGSLQTLIS